MSIETQIRLAGALAFLFALYSLWMGQLKTEGLPGGYRNPVLALELVKNGVDIDAINKAPGARAFIEKSLTKDFGYIFLYALVFTVLSLLLAKMSAPATRWLGWLAAACVILAGVFDVLENRGMLKAIATSPGQASNPLADSIRYPSLSKWALLFILCLSLGLIFLSRQGLLLIPGVLFLVAALAGLSGVLFNLLRPKFYWMFPTAIITMGLAVICVAILFTIWPAKVVDRFLTTTG